MKNAVLPMKNRWDVVRRFNYEGNDEMKPKQGSMREEMPIVTAWIDSLRLAFGKDHIDGVIRAGIKGQPVFHASENGHTVGTPVPHGVAVVADERGKRCIVVERDGTRHKHVENEGKSTKGAIAWPQ